MYNFQTLDPALLSDHSLKIIIIGICLGIIAGTVITVIYKSITYGFLRQMIKKEIFTPDRAIRIDDLDFIGKLYIKNELKYAYKTLRRYVICANEEELVKHSSKEKNEFKKLPVDKALFYLPEENRIKAELRFTPVRNPIGSILFTVILAAAACYFALFAAPELLQMLDNFISSLN